MIIDRVGLAVLIAAFNFSGGILYADTIIGTVDLSANVRESILPGGTLFQDSKPLFDTAPDPKQSAQLLHLAATGVNGSGRSTNISGAFTSSLAESDGNGGVGVSQLIFGNPGGSDPNSTSQLFAQSLWTDTFVFNGSVTSELKLHLHIPALQVGLLGVPPRRSGPSATETAEARATLDAVFTHLDGTGFKFHTDFGLREFERQIPSGSDLLNIADVKVLGPPPGLTFSVKFNGDDFNPTYTIDSVLLDAILAPLTPGDTVSWVYTLTAQGTTHGFERGYDAFLGDPFGGDVITDNLRVTIVPAGVPEASTTSLMLLGLAELFVWRWHKVRSSNTFIGS